ncbi:MAG: methyltransferase [Nitrospirales bacterium]|nr:MAG: methyltransferase [Nitrospirales bacterium]
MGQFMTPAPIGSFMASLFNDFEGESLALLDPGAGVGSLTAAFVDEFAHRSQRPKKIFCTAYEIEPILVEYLKTTLLDTGKLAKNAGMVWNDSLKSTDFIKDAAELLKIGRTETWKDSHEFSHIIMNPPYKKIHSTSEHRKLLQSVGIEATNLYIGFLSLGIKLLKPGGELVAIVPRSFCNGPYFRSFRNLLLNDMAIRRIHVFDSRKRAFKDDEVLQENIIFHAVKNGSRGKVTITSSPDGLFGRDKIGKIVAENMTYKSVPYSSVVRPGDNNKFIHITTSELDQNILDRLSVFTHTLDDLGIQVSTGPVVDFRMKGDLLKNFRAGAAPLLYPTHFQNSHIDWPKDSKKPNAIRVSSNTKSWLWENNGHYVLTRRFTTKEEKKRVVSAIYDSSLKGDLVGFENHLNVFHSHQKGLPKFLAQGLAFYLNSSLIDRYFRQFNGHTQVNATDLRSLLYPSLETLKRLGKTEYRKNLSQQEIDDRLEKEIHAMAETSKIDPVRAQQKIDEALAIVKELGMPTGQHNERSALTLLAILNLTPEGLWENIERPLMGITPIMNFCREHYGKEYAPNTRENFRRQTMHQFVDAGIAVYNPDQPDRAVNSPKACYQVSSEAFDVISQFKTKNWKKLLDGYLKESKTLAQQYAKEREMQMIPVEIREGQEITLTPGAHSKLIKDIIEEFAPRYAPGSEVIYVGDTGDKIGFFEPKKLSKMGVEIDKHGKMPDVVLYFPKKDWLLLVESVTSHGPVNAKRHAELARLFQNSRPGLLYVTAFPDRGTMAKYLADISWETEVWVAEAPTHMIHFNGERFLGPYED